MTAGESERRRETLAPGWYDRHPGVYVSYACDACGMGVDWDSADFYRVHGSIPLTVEQARKCEEPCGCFSGSMFRLEAFSVWAPRAADDDEPLLEWQLEDANA